MTETQRIDPELDLLLRMRERLSDPARWHQGGYGNADSACLFGTVNLLTSGSVIGGFSDESNGLVCVRLIDALGSHSLIDFNDDPRTTHADVLNLLDRAIAACTAELTETA